MATVLIERSANNTSSTNGNQTKKNADTSVLLFLYPFERPTYTPLDPYPCGNFSQKMPSKEKACFQEITNNIFQNKEEQIIET